MPDGHLESSIPRLNDSTTLLAEAQGSTSLRVVSGFVPRTRAASAVSLCRELNELKKQIQRMKS